MEIETVKVGYLETNCYILKKQKHAIVIDPGSEYNKIIKKIKDSSDIEIIREIRSNPTLFNMISDNPKRFFSSISKKKI